MANMEGSGTGEILSLTIMELISALLAAVTPGGGLLYLQPNPSASKVVSMDVLVLPIWERSKLLPESIRALLMVRVPAPESVIV